MIQINLENLSQVDSKHGLSYGEMEKEAALIPTYLKQIEDLDQGFINVIEDSSIIEKINSFSANVAGKYEDIVVLGIGGSALGSICLQQSLTHHFQNEKEKNNFPKLHVTDNIDPTLISDINSIVDISKTLFIVVTKSGNTAETLSQYMFFKNECIRNDLEIKDHFLFITDPESGLLRKIANNEGIITFDVPKNIGGRFSIFTPVSLLPAKLIGIDIEKIIEGAKSMKENFLSENFEKNLSFQLAIVQFLLAKKDKNINVLIPYSQKLIRFADWYRQLLSESIGKKNNKKNEKVYIGITPISALGATDQHSQSQLYNEGPNDKLHIFIEVQNFSTDVQIPNLYPEEKQLDYLKNISFGQLLNTEMKGTIQSLTENGRPNITIEIDEVNEYTLGELLFLFKGATTFLGELFEINAFDQPGVELSKQITKQLLS